MTRHVPCATNFNQFKSNFLAEEVPLSSQSLVPGTFTVRYQRSSTHIAASRLISQQLVLFSKFCGQPVVATSLSDLSADCVDRWLVRRQTKRLSRVRLRMLRTPRMVRQNKRLSPVRLRVVRRKQRMLLRRLGNRPMRISSGCGHNALVKNVFYQRPYDNCSESLV